MKVAARLPDGTSRTLLEINDWDFNWQDFYQFAEPVRLPAGTELTLDAVHDNSADNPQNPRDPPGQVRWGEQTFNEMSLAFLCLVPVNETSTPSADGTDPGTLARLRKADTDGDKRLSADEIIAALGKQRTVDDVRKIIDRFDRDGDKHLNLEESLTALKATAKK
jgi:hypothetical protein